MFANTSTGNCQTFPLGFKVMENILNIHDVVMARASESGYDVEALELFAISSESLNDPSSRVDAGLFTDNYRLTRLIPFQIMTESECD